MLRTTDFVYQTNNGMRCLELWRDNRDRKDLRTVRFVDTAEFEGQNRATFLRVVMDRLNSTEFMGPDAPPLLLPFVVFGDLPDYILRTLELKTRVSQNKEHEGDACEDLRLVNRPLLLKIDDEIVRAENARVYAFHIPDNDEWLKLLA